MFHSNFRVHSVEQFSPVGMKLPNENKQKREFAAYDEPDLDELGFRQVVAEASSVYVAVYRTDGNDQRGLFDGLFNDR